MRTKEGEKGGAMYDHSGLGPSCGGIVVRDHADTNTHSSAISGLSYKYPPGVENTFFTGNRYFQAAEVEVFCLSQSRTWNESSRKRDFCTAQLQQNAELWETATFNELPGSMKAALRTEQQMLMEAKEELKELRDAFQQEKQLIEFFASDNSMDIITFNASGEIMSIRKGTLGLCKESVLAKHFSDPLCVKVAGDRVRSVEKWNCKEVESWISNIVGLSEDAAMILNNRKMNGAELLSIENDSLKLLGLGITRLPTLILLTKQIRQLKEGAGAGVRLVEKWSEEEVATWISNIVGLSEDAAMVLKSHKMNGADLLPLDNDSLKLMGVTKMPTLVLVTTEIRKLRTGDQGRAFLIEQSAYCFGKILDHLRLHALCRTFHDLTPILPPTIRAPYRDRFKRIVEYYFPSDSSLFE